MVHSSFTSILPSTEFGSVWRVSARISLQDVRVAAQSFCLDVKCPPPHHRSFAWGSAKGSEWGWGHGRNLPHCAFISMNSYVLGMRHKSLLSTMIRLKVFVKYHVKSFNYFTLFSNREIIFLSNLSWKCWYATFLKQFSL